MADVREFSVDIGDVELAVVEWPGDSDPVLLLHATGFHSRCWNEVVKRLPNQHIFAVDLRYHGGSGASGTVDWQVMATDIRILVERLDLYNLVGVGHSIGGHLVTRAAAALPRRFKQLVLLDPVIMSPETYAAMHDIAGRLDAADHPVSRRKNRWEDASEMFHRFRDKHPFKTWNAAVLRDYCDYALRPSDEEGVLELQCDPINEAAIYVGQAGNEIVHGELPHITTPVTLLRAPPAEDLHGDLSASPTWPQLASALPCCREVYLPDHNHFIPMQDPELVARYVLEAQADDWQQNTAEQGVAT
jgi:pimeloyl-ACP methyl ester carboxylesterase